MKEFIRDVLIGGLVLGLILVPITLIQLNNIVRELENDNNTSVYVFVPRSDMKLGEVQAEDDFVIQMTGNITPVPQAQNNIQNANEVFQSDYIGDQIQDTEIVRQSDEVAYMLQTTRRATK